MGDLRLTEGERCRGEDNDCGELDKRCRCGEGVFGIGDGDLGWGGEGVCGGGVTLGLPLGGELCGDVNVKAACGGEDVHTGDVSLVTSVLAPKGL